jgi:tetratricopeptide (TPR) repeat protein
MKKFTFLFMMIALLASLSLFAQNSQTVKPKETEDYKRQLTVYQLASRYNDVAVAKSALYNMLAIDPSNISLLDSLAYYYFDYQQFAPAIIVAKDILSINPNHLAAIEICATGFENLGIQDQALTYYESLYLKNNDLYNLYKIAFLQFNLKRYKESGTSADIIINNKKSEELKLVFGTGDNKQQEIIMKAAIYNLKGMISKDEGDKANAKKHFEEALKLAPDFYLAKESLRQL